MRIVFRIGRPHRDRLQKGWNRCSAPSHTATEVISITETSTLRYYAEDFAGNHTGVKTNHYTIADPAALSGYEAWAVANSVDPVNLMNLLEYALDGDLTVYGDSGPVLINDGGEFNYVHTQRNDDSNLIYRVESCADLKVRI